ncbi:hypothetical protein CsSME_00006236 [Camellia sinensis var. sinensis]
MYSNSLRFTSFPSLHMSTICPATSPSDPTAEPNSAMARTTRSGETPMVFAATCSNARERRASPARTAVSSPKTLWLVGLPRRRSSLSMHGKSSWMSDMVWIISTAQAIGTASDSSPPTSSHEARQRIGRTRLPPARREYLIAWWIFIGSCNGTASSSALFTFVAFVFMYSSNWNLGTWLLLCGLLVDSWTCS